MKLPPLARRAFTSRRPLTVETLEDRLPPGALTSEFWSPEWLANSETPSDPPPALLSEYLAPDVPQTYGSEIDPVMVSSDYQPSTPQVAPAPTTTFGDYTDADMVLLAGLFPPTTPSTSGTMSSLIADADAGPTPSSGDTSTSTLGEPAPAPAAPPTGSGDVGSTTSAPVQILSVSDDSGASASDRITNDDTPRIGGSAAPGATVQIDVNAQPIGTATADANGAWVADLSSLPEGTYYLVAHTEDWSSSDSTTLTIDRTGPALSMRLPQLTLSTSTTLLLDLDSGSSDWQGYNVGIDVDQNGDGEFQDAELNAYEIIVTPGQTASVRLTDLRPGENLIRARASDVAGNETILSGVVASGAPGGSELYFEANAGQTDSQALFLTRTAEGTAFLTADGMVTSVPMASSMPGEERTGAFALRFLNDQGMMPPPMDPMGSMDSMDPMAPSEPEQPSLTGEGALTAVSNYFVGSDSSKWVTGVENYSGVRHHDVWDGIDVAYTGSGSHLRFDLHVAPGADAGQIQLGADLDQMSLTPTLEDDGTLTFTVGGTYGPIAQQVYLSAPVAYQIGASGQRIDVEASYELTPNGIGIALGQYDATRELVIDPTLIFATFQGGPADEGQGGGSGPVATDDADNVFLSGRSFSATFPGPNPPVGNSGGRDAVLIKLSPDGRTRLYATFFGGSDDDGANGVATDGAGAAYIVGDTSSNDLPPIAGAFQSTDPDPGGNDAFIAKFDVNGVLVYSTYLGGSNNDGGSGIAVDDTGAAYVTGGTSSGGFGMGMPFPVQLGAFQPVKGAGRDAYVFKLSPDGSSAVFGSFLGGAGDEGGIDIALDSSNRPVIVGGTNSGGLATGGVFQGALQGGRDAFVCFINEDATARLFFTYFGSVSDEDGLSVEVDPGDGTFFLCGSTLGSPAPFPTTPGAFRTTRSGDQDAFVAHLTSNGAGLVWSTLLGGRNDDIARELDIDADGNVYVAGTTMSRNFPIQQALRPTLANTENSDAFVSILSPDGALLRFSTALGGLRDEDASGIVAYRTGGLYVGGETNSNPRFPDINAIQPSNAGGTDLFVARIDAFDAINGTGFENLRGDALENNDTTDAATHLGILDGRLTLTELTLAPKADTGDFDYDCYRMVIGADGTLGVTLTVNLANGPLAFNVYRRVGDFLVPLASATVPPAVRVATLSANVVVGDEIYVNVLGTHVVSGQLSQGSYSLGLNLNLP